MINFSSPSTMRVRKVGDFRVEADAAASFDSIAATVVIRNLVVEILLSCCTSPCSSKNDTARRTLRGTVLPQPYSVVTCSR